MNGITVGDVVVVHCQGPREKMWGLLLRLDAVGLALRGLGLDSVEDWFRQEAAHSRAMIGPTTVFLPMHRVQRIDLDETSGPVPSFSERYRDLCGRRVVEALSPAEQESQL